VLLLNGKIRLIQSTTSHFMLNEALDFAKEDGTAYHTLNEGVLSGGIALLPKYSFLALDVIVSARKLFSKPTTTSCVAGYYLHSPKVRHLCVIYLFLNWEFYARAECKPQDVRNHVVRK
jgi:hypothetical protein